LLGHSDENFYEVRPFYVVFYLGIVAIALNKNQINVGLGKNFV